MAALQENRARHGTKVSDLVQASYEIPDRSIVAEILRGTKKHLQDVRELSDGLARRSQ
jgi:hypothetical protein